MIPIVASLLGSLAENGLGLLSSALQAKGKEVVENTFGIKIPDNPSQEDIAKLRQLQYDHEERLIELGIEKAKMELAELQVIADVSKNENNNVSERWSADMSSDSYLSKNIRPLTLIFILLAYFTFAMLSVFNLETRGAYVELLGQWGMLVMTAYFGSRGVEKVMEIRSKK